MYIWVHCSRDNKNLIYWLDNLTKDEVLKNQRLQKKMQSSSLYKTVKEENAK